jgi:OmcA/MtrC family decaheme c-type cytochrome
VDFKQLIHGIHGNKKRTSPLVVVGFRGTIVDYGHVKFPGEVRNCLYCHVESGGKGTFEVPPNTGLGSTTKTGSVVSPLPGLVDVDPSNNLRISPVASACSGCHNSSEDRSHMVRNGASFGQTQEVLEGKERCANCHGAGREKDVRRVHEVSARIQAGRGSEEKSDDEDEKDKDGRKKK